MNHLLLLISVLTSVALTTCQFAHADDPSLHQVYQAAEGGRMADAQKMMGQVLSDHPNSAKAHFVEAELLAKQGQLNASRRELAKAEQLSPGLPFAKPQAVRVLQSKLANGSDNFQPRLQSTQPDPQAFPWGYLLLGVGLLVFIVVVAKAMVRRNPPQQFNPPGFGPVGVNPNYAAGGPVPMQTYGPGVANPMGGLGSGIMGGLATGAAVGAGMVAGEALMHHFMNGNSTNTDPVAMPSTLPDADFPDGMGGQDFGISDGAWDDNSSLGGDDWN